MTDLCDFDSICYLKIWKHISEAACFILKSAQLFHFFFHLIEVCFKRTKTPQIVISSLQYYTNTSIKLARDGKLDKEP